MTADKSKPAPPKRNKKRERGKNTNSNNNPVTKNSQPWKVITQFNIQTITAAPESGNACRYHPNSGEMNTKFFYIKPVNDLQTFLKNITPVLHQLSI
jgi:hypothetical protein